MRYHRENMREKNTVCQPIVPRELVSFRVLYTRLVSPPAYRRDLCFPLPRESFQAIPEQFAQ